MTHIIFKDKNEIRMTQKEYEDFLLDSSASEPEDSSPEAMKHRGLSFRNIKRIQSRISRNELVPEAAHGLHSPLLRQRMTLVGKHVKYRRGSEQPRFTHHDLTTKKV